MYNTYVSRTTVVYAHACRQKMVQVIGATRSVVSQSVVYVCLSRHTTRKLAHKRRLAVLTGAPTMMCVRPYVAYDLMCIYCCCCIRYKLSRCYGIVQAGKKQILVFSSRRHPLISSTSLGGALCSRVYVTLSDSRCRLDYIDGLEVRDRANAPRFKDFTGGRESRMWWPRVSRGDYPVVGLSGEKSSRFRCKKSPAERIRTLL